MLTVLPARNMLVVLIYVSSMEDYVRIMVIYSRNIVINFSNTLI